MIYDIIFLNKKIWGDLSFFRISQCIYRIEWNKSIQYGIG